MNWSVVQWRGLNRVYREEYLWLVKWSAVKWSEVQWSEVKWSAVNWSVVQWTGLNQGVPWSLFMVGEVKWSAVKWSEGPVKNGVLYLWINNIRN